MRRIRTPIGVHFLHLSRILRVNLQVFEQEYADCGGCDKWGGWLALAEVVIPSRCAVGSMCRWAASSTPGVPSTPLGGQTDQGR